MYKIDTNKDLLYRELCSILHNGFPWALQTLSVYAAMTA